MIDVEAILVRGSVVRFRALTEAGRRNLDHFLTQERGEHPTFLEDGTVEKDTGHYDARRMVKRIRAMATGNRVRGIVYAPWTQDDSRGPYGS